MTTGVVTTLAGSSTCSNVDGGSATFYTPTASTILTINVTKWLVISDNRSVRIVRLVDGYTQTLFGSPGVSGYVDAAGTTSRFGTVYGIVGNGSDSVFVADLNNSAIRTMKIEINAVTSTYAGGTVGNQDGPMNQVRFNGPVGITRDAAGALYLAETNNRAIRKIH